MGERGGVVVRPATEYVIDARKLAEAALRARGDDAGCVCDFCAKVRAALALLEAVDE